MSFWDIFKNKNLSVEEDPVPRLQKKILHLLPNSDDKQLIKVTCIAGLLAKVTSSNPESHQNDIAQMKKVLKEWSRLSPVEIETIAEVLVEEKNNLSLPNNQSYTHPLNSILNKGQKFALLKSLVALSHQETESEEEGEEIRIIAKGLRLSHQQYVSAREVVKTQES